MNILVIYPHGNALNPVSGAETRIWNFISSLIKLNFNVSILHSIKSKGLEDPKLKKKVNVYYYRDINFLKFSDWYLTDLNPFFLIKLYQIIRKQKFDIIQIEFPWGLISTKLLAKNKHTYIIYDSLGVESEFMKIAATHPNFPKFLKPIAVVYSKIYEKLACKLADVIINVSEVDRNYFINNYKINKNKTFLIQIPSSLNDINIEDLIGLKTQSREKLCLPKEKTIILFHGGLPHPPNQEAFDLIKDYISRRINYPDLLYVLAGNNLNKFKKKNIISLGYVNNLKSLIYSADFAIVPIKSGSGMRVKCMDYITASLPFITTEKGIEGIEFLRNGVNCLIYKAVNNEFLDGIKLLYENKKVREKLQKNLRKKSKIINKNNIEKRIYKLYFNLKRNK